MRRISRTFPLLAALLLGGACAVLVACGGSGNGDDLIGDQQAAAMIDQLDTIRSAVARGSCDQVGSEVDALQRQVNDLSSRVDARLRARLQEGVNNLADIGPGDCLARRAETTTTETQTTETIPTTPTETVPTTPTETVPTTPTETVPTTPTETVPTTPTTPTETTPGGAVGPSDGSGVGGAEPTP